jgi:hypothetical protein
MYLSLFATNHVHENPQPLYIHKVDLFCLFVDTLDPTLKGVDALINTYTSLGRVFFFVFSSFQVHVPSPIHIWPPCPTSGPNAQASFILLPYDGNPCT